MRSQAEVRDFDVPFKVDEDVGGFQVAVQHIALVNMRKSRTYLDQVFQILREVNWLWLYESLQISFAEFGYNNEVEIQWNS